MIQIRSKGWEPFLPFVPAWLASAERDPDTLEGILIEQEVVEACEEAEARIASGWRQFTLGEKTTVTLTFTDGACLTHSFTRDQWEDALCLIP